MSAPDELRTPLDAWLSRAFMVGVGGGIVAMLAALAFGFWRLALSTGCTL